MSRLAPGGTAWERSDLGFHSAIAAASHNLVAIHIMEGLKSSFNSYFKAKKLALGPERKDLLHAQHTAIYEAIRPDAMPTAPGCGCRSTWSTSRR